MHQLRVCVCVCVCVCVIGSVHEREYVGVCSHYRMTMTNERERKTERKKKDCERERERERGDMHRAANGHLCNLRGVRPVVGVCSLVWTSAQLEHNVAPGGIECLREVAMPVGGVIAPAVVDLHVCDDGDHEQSGGRVCDSDELPGHA